MRAVLIAIFVTAFVALISVMNSPTHATTCQVGFRYLPANTLDDGSSWMEDNVWMYEYTSSDKMGADVFVTVFVSPVTEDMGEADIIDFAVEEDGIVFGTQWLSFQKLEDTLRSTVCQ